MSMDLVSRLLRLTPDERIEVAREAAAELDGSSDDDVLAAWERALERHVGDDDGQLPLFDQATAGSAAH